MPKPRRPRSRTSWPESGPLGSTESAEPPALSGRGARPKPDHQATQARAPQAPSGGAALLRVQSMIGNRAAVGLVTGARYERFFERPQLSLASKDTEEEGAAADLAKKRHEDAVEYVQDYFKRLTAIGELLGSAKDRAFNRYLVASGHVPEAHSRAVLELYLSSLAKVPGTLQLLALLAQVTRGGARLKRLLLGAAARGKRQQVEFKPITTPDDLGRKSFEQLMPLREHVVERLDELRKSGHQNPRQAVAEYLEDTLGDLPDPALAKLQLDQASDEFELLLYRRFYAGRAHWIKTGDERQLKGMPHAVRRRIVRLAGKPSLRDALEEWSLREEEGEEGA